MAEDDRRIVVGVDGTETAAAALRWAVRQSGYTGARLEAVLAWESPATYEWAPDLTDPADVEAAAREVLDKALADVAAPVTRSVVRGNAVRVLLDAARGAELLVLGSQGTDELKGSVGLHCLHHATCPVLVVRG
ncbi:universal stress protein [Umezawaea tangerina]|uniref:Nucleotide-binding universal stress UspA family protein n=1 Tax=Umezawaea tangerina TaxID=84725 RepID=A0A2T0SWP6_9PSEU|nr:universal stress protein [Umezawaea tangerina]PRY37810.1 nucleotide-binding universal stress UspA family protein [Umezawaea tangerina]